MNTVWERFNSIRYFGLIICDLILSELKKQTYWKIETRTRKSKPMEAH